MPQVSGTQILIYSTTSYELVAMLKGHTGPVTSIRYTEDDLGMVSAGFDGAVYEWRIESRERVSDHVLKSTQYEALALGPTTKGKFSCVAAGRGVLREIAQGNVVNEAASAGWTTQIEISHEERVIFASNKEGSIVALSWPLDSKLKLQEVGMHAAAISRLCLASDGTFLFSASEDGQLFVFETLSSASRDRDAVRLANEQAAIELDVVLVSRSEVLERIATSDELEHKIREAQRQSEYQMHLKEQFFLEQIRKDKETAARSLEIANERYEQLKKQKDVESLEMSEQRQMDDAAHMRAAEELENLYERKLAMEAARFEALRREKADMQSRFEEKLHEATTEARQRESALRSEMGSRAQDADSRVSYLEGELHELQRKYEELLRQEERDNDAELAQQKTMQMRSLALERENAQTLKSETAVLRKKFEAFQVNSEKTRGLLQSRENEVKKLQRERAELEKLVSLLRKDVAEREEAIRDKERRMAELKASNTELEKFKYVLDYKLREIKREIEPRDEQIVQMRDTIRELDDELQRDYRNNAVLEQSLAEKQTKVEALQAELKKRSEQVRARERRLLAFGRELHRLVAQTEGSQWKAGLVALYHSYVKQQTAELEPNEEQKDVEDEFGRHRVYLERALDTLTSRVDRTEGRSRFEMQRKVDENLVLVDEVNTLRYENRDLRSKVAQLTLELQQFAGKQQGVRRVPSAGALRPAAAAAVRLEGGGSPGGSPGGGGGKDAAGTGSRGQLIKGSTMTVTRDRPKTMAINSQIQRTERETEIRQTEMDALRGQVTKASADHDAAAGGASTSGQSFCRGSTGLPARPRTASQSLRTGSDPRFRRPSSASRH